MPCPPLESAAVPLAGVDIEQLEMRAQPAAAAVENVIAFGAEPAPDTSPSRRQTISFFAPQSVVALAEEPMTALHSGSEPRGSAFERMLALAILEWMAAPAHRHPISSCATVGVAPSPVSNRNE